MAAKRYEQRYKRGHRIRDLVAADEARGHLQFLRSKKVAWKVIEKKSGLSHQAVWRIWKGTAKRTTKRASDKILAIGLHDDPRVLAGDSSTRASVLRLEGQAQSPSGKD